MNLDSLRSEIETHLQKNGFILFRGAHRETDSILEIRWDTIRYPNYKDFLDAAKALDIKLIVLHHEEFTAEILEHVIEDLPSSGMDYEDQRTLENRLRELTMYDGFTCEIQISFDYNQSTYMFDLRTDWFREISDLMDQLDVAGGESDEDDDETLGGYYSKN
jgi:hypothetical protein